MIMTITYKHVRPLCNKHITGRPHLSVRTSAYYYASFPKVNSGFRWNLVFTVCTKHFKNECYFIPSNPSLSYMKFNLNMLRFQFYLKQPTLPKWSVVYDVENGLIRIQKFIILSRTCVWLQTGFGLLTRFVNRLQIVTTSNYGDTALQITRAHTNSSQFAFTSRFLVTDLNNGDSAASVLTSLPAG
jgi:hypothetical protein